MSLDQHRAGPLANDARYRAVLEDRARAGRRTARGVSALAEETSAAVDASPWSLRIPELLLGFLLCLEAYSVPLLPVSVPVNEAAMLGLLGLALCRRAARDTSRLEVAALFAALVCVYLAGLSVVQEIPTGDWGRRLVRIAALAALVACFAGRRVDLRSVLTGLLAAMALNVPLFYLGLVPAPYQNHLSGLLADKNVAGLYYALVPLLLLGFLRSPRLRLAVLAAAGVCVFLTGSRTSLAGFLCAVVWIWVSPRLAAGLRLVLLALFAWVVTYAEENLARIGIFADRAGTDWFRAQIHSATSAKVALTPWTGAGLGEARIQMEESVWFFHDSYAALYVEGGLVLLTALLAAYAVYGLRLTSRRLRTPSRVAVEAAAVVVLVSATQLGEVFITIPSMLVLAAGVSLSLQEADAPLEDEVLARRRQRIIREAAMRGV